MCTHSQYALTFAHYILPILANIITRKTQNQHMYNITHSHYMLAFAHYMLTTLHVKHKSTHTHNITHSHYRFAFAHYMLAGLEEIRQSCRSQLLRDEAGLGATDLPIPPPSDGSYVVKVHVSDVCLCICVYMRVYLIAGLWGGPGRHRPSYTAPIWWQLRG